MIEIIDNALPNFEDIEVYARQADYGEVEYDGRKYQHIHVPKEDFGLISLTSHYLKKPLVGWSIFRTGHHPTGWIHADTNCGGYAAVLYVTDADGLQGTALWSHNQFGPKAPSNPIQSEVDQINGDANDESKWSLRSLVIGKKNRVVIYPCEYFHSVYPKQGPDSRIIQCAFMQEVK